MATKLLNSASCSFEPRKLGEAKALAATVPIMARPARIYVLICKIIIINYKVWDPILIDINLKILNKELLVNSLNINN